MEILYKGGFFDKNNIPIYPAPNGEDVEAVLRRDGDAVISALKNAHEGRDTVLPYGWEFHSLSDSGMVWAEFLRGAGVDKRRSVPTIEIHKGQVVYSALVQYRNDECDYCGTKMSSEPGEPVLCPECDIFEMSDGEYDLDEDEEDDFE